MAKVVNDHQILIFGVSLLGKSLLILSIKTRQFYSGIAALVFIAKNREKAKRKRREVLGFKSTV